MKSFQFTFCRAWVFVLAIAAMTVAVSGRSAQADLIFNDVFTGTNFKIQASNGVDLAGTTLQAVTIRAVGLNGALPSVFAGDNSGGAGTGITTTALHQVWAFNAVATPTSDNTYSINQTLDSHFLVYEDQLLTIIPLSENRPTADATFTTDGGYGTYLQGSFVLNAMEITPTTNWNIAYLVLPKAATVTLDFEIGAAGYASEGVSASFAVPEPSTFVLSVLGALGLLIFRRRLAV